ncbi:hypothetical protein DF185_09995, partial [Marinifilum breve]
MKKLILSLFLVCSWFFIYAQSVGIGKEQFTPHHSAALEIQSNAKGVLIPRLTFDERNSIVDPVKGLLVFQKDLENGFYYFNGSAWVPIVGSKSSGDDHLYDELQSLDLSDENILYLSRSNYVDLSRFLNNTDDQALSLSGNVLTLEDGGTVDLSAYLDNSDDQTVTDFSLNAATNILTLSLEDGNTQTVDLSTLNNQGTDDQTVTDFSLDAATNILTLSLEGGNTKMVDLSALNNSGTDDQVLSLSGNVLTLEDGGTVDLSSYLDNTDDQTVTDFSL